MGIASQISLPDESLRAASEQSALNGKHEGDDGTGWGYGTVDDGNGDDYKSSKGTDDRDDDAYQCSWTCITCCLRALGFGYHDVRLR